MTKAELQNRFNGFLARWIGRRVDTDGAKWVQIDDKRIKDGYFISNTGRVMSARKKTIKEMTVCKHRDGYGQVCFMKQDGTTISLKVHRLVAKAFIPNPDNKPQINHKDENKLNNNAENLEWCTAYENNHHSKADYYKGLKILLRGVGVSRNAKITAEDVRDIRLFRQQGVKLKDISRVYKLSESSLSTIANNKEWRWV